MKKFILNADDLAKSKSHNSAVLEGYKSGLLKSASIMSNMPDYPDAIERVVKPNPNLSTGIHLNIMEGKALNPELRQLCDAEGNFNNSYISLILKSCKKSFLKEVEIEFRSQIERALADTKLTHIDSHVHTHGICEIFKIATKLAVEYKIPYIRTQSEKPYFVKGQKCNPINYIKILLLDYFTRKNKKFLKNYNLATNDYLIGIGYSGLMNSTTLLEGVKSIKNAQIVEALIHPTMENQEFELTKDMMLKDLIELSGYEIGDFGPL